MTNANLLAIYNKAESDTNGLWSHIRDLEGDEGHIAGLRALAAATWDEGRKAAYEEFAKDPRGLYYFAQNPYANALVVPPQD